MSIQDKAFNNALAVIKGVGGFYHIIGHDGQEYVHDPEAVIARKVRTSKEGRKRGPNRSAGLPHGWASQYARQQLEGIQVGEVRSVPFDRLDPRTAMSVVANTMNRWFGPKTYTCETNLNTQSIDVIREQ